MIRRSAALALLFVVASAFAYNPATLIQRKWKQTPESVKNYFDAAIALMPAEQAEQIKAQRAMFEGMALSATMEFKEGKITIVQGPQTVDGTYTFSADNKSLTVTAMGQQVTYAVKDLTDTKLVLTDPNVQTDITYQPA